MYATNQLLHWESSDIEIATVSNTGVVTAIKEGVTTITVTTSDGNFTDICVVTVMIPVDGIYITEPFKMIPLNTSHRLTVVIFPPEATNQDIIWSSSDETIASVSTDGTVTGHRVGEAVITAKSESLGFTDTSTVKIYIPVTGVSIPSPPGLLPLGAQTTITANIIPADASNQQLHWASSNPSVAVVDGNGMVTGLSVGETTITVTTDYGAFIAEVTVTVVIHVTDITLSTYRRELYVGEYFTLTHTIHPSNATDQKAAWTSSAPEIASVDQTGRVTAHRAGSAAITITAEDGGITASCLVIVNNRLLSSLTLDPPNMALHPNERETFTAVITPSTATNQVIHWVSSGPAVASVDFLTGEVIARSNGRAVITAITQDASGIIVRGEVEVTTPVTRVSIAPREVTIGISDYHRLSLSFFPATASDTGAHWTSSNPEIAIVDEWGVVRGVSVGKATITAASRDGGHTATSTVTVADSVIKPTSLRISPARQTLPVGANHVLSPLFSPANSMKPELIWTSSNTDTVTVDEITGVITAIAPGNAAITAKTIDEDGGFNLTATSEIEVIGAAEKSNTIELLLVNGSTNANLNMPVGQRSELLLSWFPSDIRETITSHSSNPEVAALDGHTVTAVSPGTTVITFTTENGVTATCRITVVRPGVNAIFINGHQEYEKELYIGDTFRPVITTSPVETFDIVYSRSANPNIAPIQDGIVTAVSPGETEIIFYTSSGIQAICHVTIMSGGPFFIVAESFGQGSINPSGLIEARRGSRETFTIIPDEGHFIRSVTLDGRPISFHVDSLFSYTLSDISSHHTISVQFARRPVYYNITAHQGINGSIFPMDTTDEGFVEQIPALGKGRRIGNLPYQLAPEVPNRLPADRRPPVPGIR